MTRKPTNIFDWVPPGQRTKMVQPQQPEPVAPEPKKMLPGQVQLPKQKQDTEFEYDQYLGIMVGVASHGHGQGHGPGGSHPPGGVGGGGGGGPIVNNIRMPTEPGTFSFLPTTVGSRQSYVMPAGTGVFTETGKDATLLYRQTSTARVLGAGPGVFTMNGQDATLNVPAIGQFSLGVNLAGLDFSGQVSQSATTPFYTVNYQLAPTTADIDYWYALGCRRIRLPIRWEYLQPVLNGALEPTFTATITTLINYCVTVGMKCLLDIHSFGNHFGVAIGTGANTYAAFADLWSRLATQFQSVSANILSYDIMNEPVDTGSDANWVGAAKAAIAAIRGVDTQKLIYVEGWRYSSTWNFINDNPTLHTVRDADPYNRLVISGHMYLDRDNSGQHMDWDTEAATPGSAPSGTNTNINIGVQRLAPFTDWLALHNFKGHVGECGTPAQWGNPRPVNDINWQTALQRTLDYCITKGLEIDAWSAGPFWGGYEQSVNTNGGKQSRTVTTLQTYWNNNNQPSIYWVDGPTRGTAGAESSPFTVDYRGKITGSVTFTPHSSAGGTWTPATAVLTGLNPVATFTLNIATEQISSITFTNNGGLTDQAATLYTTQRDDYDNVVANLQNVFSFQRKVATYAGACIRLRRSADDVESDFNFTSNAMYAYLDTAAIATFKGASTNLYVVKWYNQSNVTNTNGDMTMIIEGTPVITDQPEFVLDAGDGSPAIIVNGNNRMDAVSPLEGATGQVLITNVSGTNISITPSDLLSWSFVSNGMSSSWCPGWIAYPGDGTTNIYGLKSDLFFMPGAMEVDEWHVHSGSWTGGLGGAGHIKVWRDMTLMGIGDSGAASMTVDYHRNTCNMFYHRFGNSHWHGRLRDVTILNGPVSDVDVMTFAGRDITKYNTTYSHTAQTPDIVLDFAAGTYTADGGSTTLAANITNSPTRDSNGLICSGSQTYGAAGPLLNAIQSAAFTIEIDTYGLSEASVPALSLIMFKNGANNSAGISWAWGGGSGTANAISASVGATGANYLSGSGVQVTEGIPYSDAFITGYMGRERKHIYAQDATGMALCVDGEFRKTVTTAMTAFTLADIGWWSGGAEGGIWNGVKLVGRIKRIKVWRKKLTRWQQYRACENLPAKGSVPTPMLMGINAAGMEYGSGLPGGFEAYPNAAEAAYYSDRGLNCMRLPFKWERMQPTLNAPLATGELNHMKQIVAEWTAKGFTVLLDLHNYAQYYNVANSTYYVIEDGGLLTNAAFADFWSRMAQVTEFNRADVWFGLMNEPGDPRGQGPWFTSCTAATAAIRAHNVVSTIAVPGNYRATQAVSWSREMGQAFLSNYSDSANNSVFEVHSYFDRDLSGTHSEAVQGVARATWINCIRFCRENNKRFVVGECGWTADERVVQAPIEADETFELLRYADDACRGLFFWQGGPAVGTSFQTIEPYGSGILDVGFGDPRGDRPQMAVLRKWLPLPSPPPSPYLTYYVDTAGSDSNDGLTTATPWKTIAKVNASTFAPGSFVLFKGGQTFSGGIVVPSSGTSGSPVTIGSYGTGRATISAPSGTVAITVQDKQYVEIKDLICVGAGITDSAQNGIDIGNSHNDTSKLAGLKVSNCDVSGFGAYGIIVGGWNSSAGTTGCIIEDCVCHGNTGKTGTNATAGIFFWGAAYGLASTTPNHVNPIVRRCKAYGNTGNGVGTTNWTGSGIVLGECSGALVEYCVAYDNGVNSATSAGPFGMFLFDNFNSTIQYSESYNNKTGSSTDGGGFDLDGGCIGCVVQFCYSHGNMGPGYLMFKYAGLPWDSNTFRYNISENDGTAVASNDLAAGISIQSNSGALTNCRVYGNTVYQNVSLAASCCTLAGNASSDIRLINNIFMTGSAGSFLVNVNGINPGAVFFTGNNYYSTGSFKVRWNTTSYGTLAAWQTATNQEKVAAVSSGFSVNPQLTSPGTGGTVSSTVAGTLASTLTAYRLQTGSPMINAGRNLSTEFGISNGGHDFYGNVAPTGSYDIGAHEAG